MAANDIADLLLRIDATTEGLRRELKRADSSLDGATKSMGKRVDALDKRIASFAMKAGRGFVSIGKAAAAMSVGAVGALGAIITSSANTAREIQNLSRVANSAPEEFQRMAFAAQQYGIEQDKLADILKDMSDRVGDFLSTGGGPMADFFENIAPQVGVTAEQFRKLSGPDALQLYVSSLEKANVSQNEMTFYMEAIASDSTLLVPLLQDNGRAMAEMGDEAERVGAIIRDDTLDALGRVDEELRSLRSSFRATGAEIAEGALPALQEFSNTIGSPEVQRGLETFTQGIIKFGGAAATAIAKMASLAEKTGEFIAQIFAGPDPGDVEATLKRLNELNFTLKNNVGFTGDAAEEFRMLKSALELTGGVVGEVDGKLVLLAPVVSRATRVTNELADAMHRVESSSRPAIGQLNEVIVTARRMSTVLPASMRVVTESAEEESEATATAYNRGIERMRDAMGDFFQDLIVDGKASFDGLLDLFKRMLAEMIATAAANRVMVSLGMMSAGQAAQAGGMLGQGGFSLSGIGSSISNFGAGAMNAIGGGASFLADAGIPGMNELSIRAYQQGMTMTTGAMLAGAGAGIVGGLAGNAVFGQTSGIGSTIGGGLGMAIGGPIGAGIGSFLGAGIESLVQGKPSDKRQYASGGFSATDQILSGFDGRKFSQENQDAAAALLGQIQMMGQAIGGTTAAGSVSVGGRTGLRLSTGEGEGSFRTFASEADLLTAAWEEVLEGATNLVPVVKQLALGFEGSAEAGVEYTRTLQALWEATGQNGATAAAQAMHQAQLTLAETYRASTNNVRVLAFEFDGSAQATAALSQALAENQGVAYQLALQYRQVRDSVSGLFGSLSESIRTSLMSQDELYNYQRGQVDTLSAALATMTDPTQIMETSQRIEQLVSGMWGRLSEEQRQEMGAGFLDTISDVERVATRQLNTQLKMIESSQERTGAIIRQSIQAAANELSASAAQQTQAAQINLQAAQLNLQAAQARMAGAEVNA